MSMKKRAKEVALIIVSAFVLSMLGAAFYTMSLDPASWDADTRAMVLMSWWSTSFLCLIVYGAALYEPGPEYRSVTHRARCGASGWMHPLSRPSR